MMNSTTRRTTLGPLNLNTFASSSSTKTAAENVSKPPRMSISGPVKRASLANGLPGRKSSVIGSVGSDNSRRSSSINSVTHNSMRFAHDPRNIGEKSFLGISIRTLIDFLQKHSFDYPVNPKMLTKPTQNDFHSIVMFLVRLIDNNLQNTGKFEDEMITIFEHLGYPFRVSKSTIVAITPHSWPSLLAMIMWLVELINYDESAGICNEGVTNPDDVDWDDPSSSEKAFYRYLGRAYEMFLSGKDDQFVKLEEQFISSFENKNILIRDEIDALQTRNTGLSHEIDEVKNRSAYLPTLETKRRELQTESTKFNNLVNDLQKHRDTLKGKVEARKGELERLQHLNAQADNDVSNLKSRISQQTISPEDVMNLVNERQRLEEAHSAIYEKRQLLQSQIWEQEMALRDKVVLLEDTVKAYHSVADMLKLRPATARNAQGRDLSIEADYRAKKREGLLKTDIRKMITPVLQDIRAELAEATLGVRSDLLAAKDVFEEVEAQEAELCEAQDGFEARLRRAEEAYRRQKDTLDQGAELHGQELHAMEMRLMQLRDTASEEARIHNATRRCDEIEAIRQQRRNEHQNKCRALTEQVTAIMSACAEHRETVQDSLDGLKSDFDHRLEHLLRFKMCDAVKSTFRTSSSLAHTGHGLNSSGRWASQSFKSGRPPSSQQSKATKPLCESPAIAGDSAAYFTRYSGNAPFSYVNPTAANTESSMTATTSSIPRGNSVAEEMIGSKGVQSQKGLTPASESGSRVARGSRSSLRNSSLSQSPMRIPTQEEDNVPLTSAARSVSPKPSTNEDSMDISPIHTGRFSSSSSPSTINTQRSRQSLQPQFKALQDLVGTVSRTLHEEQSATLSGQTTSGGSHRLTRSQTKKQEEEKASRAAMQPIDSTVEDSALEHGNLSLEATIDGGDPVQRLNF